MSEVIKVLTFGMADFKKNRIKGNELLPAAPTTGDSAVQDEIAKRRAELASRQGFRATQVTPVGGSEPTQNELNTRTLLGQ